MVGCGLDLSGLESNRVAGSCDHCNEPMGQYCNESLDIMKD
jgi:hypothetical protein